MQRRFSLAMAVFIVAASSAAATTDVLPMSPRAALHSPYFGDQDAHVLPEQGKPTVVIPVSAKTGFHGADLIRALRCLEPKFGQRVRIAVVIVGMQEATPIEVVEWDRTQRGLLETGLRRRFEFTSFKDDSGKWYATLGKPDLPHAMLIGGDGRILARELLMGRIDWELARIEALVSGKAAPRAHDEEVDNHPFAVAVNGVEPLAEPAQVEGMRVFDRHDRAALRLDFDGIVRVLRRTDDTGAKAAIEEFVLSTTDFTLAHELSRAAAAQWPAADVPWAAAFLKTGAVGRITASTDNGLKNRIGISNAAAMREMDFTLEARLYSAWDHSLVGSSSRLVLANGGTSVAFHDDPFHVSNAGWGDYRVEYKIAATMVEGVFPDHLRLPEVTRTWTDDVGFYPGATEAVDTSTDSPLSPAAAALGSALTEQRRQIFLAMVKQERIDTKPSTRPLATASATTRVAAPATAPATAEAVNDDAADAKRQLQLIGKPMAALELVNWVQGGPPGDDDGDRRLAHARGRVLLIDFMFTECPPCRAALPQLSALHDKYRERGLDVVSACASWGAKGLYRLTSEKGLTHPISVLKPDEQGKYGVQAYPTYVLIDRAGIVRDIKVGGHPSDDLVLKLLAEKAPP